MVAWAAWLPTITRLGPNTFVLFRLDLRGHCLGSVCHNLDKTLFLFLGWICGVVAWDLSATIWTKHFFIFRLDLRGPGLGSSRHNSDKTLFLFLGWICVVVAWDLSATIWTKHFFYFWAGFAGS